MTRTSKSLLAEQIELLVKHFGINRVRAALAKVTEAHEGNEKTVAPHKDAGRKRIRAIGGTVIEAIRESDPDKYWLLSEFFIRLKDRLVLPESQDIRYFAQLAGLKSIGGKSRDEMVPKLMRFLVDQPIEKLRIDIEGARNISEQQRRKGFSVLTDKLIGKP
jgi:hypothetical protein